MPKNNISMFNFKLVEAVEQHPCLYDYNLRDYSNRELTNAVWESIASQLQADVQECKNTWKNLRIVFTRYLRNQESDTSKKRKEYYLNTRMMFLCPFVRPKSSSSLSSSLHNKSESKLAQQQQQQQQQQQHRYQTKKAPMLDVVEVEVAGDSYNAIYNGSGDGGGDCVGDEGGDNGECDDDDDDDEDDDMYTEWPPIECKIDCSDTEDAIVDGANEQQQQQQQYKSEHAYNVNKNNDKYMMTITINNNNNNRNGHHDSNHTDDAKYIGDGDEEYDGDDDDTNVKNAEEPADADDDDEDDPPEIIEAQQFECHMSEESSSEMPTLYNSQGVNQTTGDEHSNHRNHNQKLPHLQYIKQQQQSVHDHQQPSTSLSLLSKNSLTNCVNSNQQQEPQLQQRRRQPQQPPQSQRHSARLSNHSNTVPVATETTLAASTRTASSKRQRRDQSSPSPSPSSSERVSDELTSDFITNYSNLLLHSNQNKHYRKWYLISLIRDLDDMSDTQFREFRSRTDAVINDIMRPSVKKIKP